jgi:hypothetical protein
VWRGLVDQAFCKSWDGMGVYWLGGQDTIPKRSVQIGDGEINRWYFDDETRGARVRTAVCIGQSPT